MSDNHDYVAAYTPGPWKVHKGYRVYSPSRLVGENGQQYFEVATCGTDYQSGSLGETEANAHLIAAAPDLLEALSDAAEFMERALAGANLKATGDDREAGVMEYQAALAAIAKAEGRGL